MILPGKTIVLMGLILFVMIVFYWEAHILLYIDKAPLKRISIEPYTQSPFILLTYNMYALSSLPPERGSNYVYFCPFVLMHVLEASVM